MAVVDVMSLDWAGRHRCGVSSGRSTRGGTSVPARKVASRFLASRRRRMPNVVMISKNGYPDVKYELELS